MDKIFKTTKSKRIAVIAGLLLLCAVVLTLYFTIGRKFYYMFSDNTKILEWLDQFGRWDEVVFVGIRALQTVVKFIPAEPLEIGSGYVWGIWGGLFYCMLGTEIGSFIILLITKLFGMRAINLFVPQERIDKIKFLQNEKKLKTTLFFIYLIPGTPKDLITFSYNHRYRTNSFNYYFNMVRCSTWREKHKACGHCVYFNPCRFTYRHIFLQEIF